MLQFFVDDVPIVCDSTLLKDFKFRLNFFQTQDTILHVHTTALNEK